MTDRGRARGEVMAESIMSAIAGRVGITKGAGMPAELQLVETAIRPLCAMIGEYEEATEHTLRELKQQAKILRAIARQPEQVPRGFMPYQPDQWRLTPKLPPQQVNGHDYDYTPGSDNDRPN